MPMICSWTPAYAFFTAPYESGTFQADLGRFARLIRGQLEEPPKKIITNPTVSDVRRLVSSSKFLACDIETAPEDGAGGWTGKDPTRARLKSVGLGTTTWAISRWWSGGAAVERAIAEVLADPRVTKVFHNGPWFDLRVLSRYGMAVNSWEDTRDLRRALSATSRLSLRYLGSIYTDFEPWKEEDEGEKGYEQSDKEKLLAYNGLDCVVTARIWAQMSSENLDIRVQKLYQLHKDLSESAARMHSRGFLVHKANRKFMAWGLMQQYREQAKALLEYVALPGFSCTPNAMRSLIYKRHATEKVSRFNLPDPIDPKMWTKKGDALSVDYNALLRIVVQPNCPADLRTTINLYWDAASTWKARSTFVVSKKVGHAIGRDRRLRPGWNSCGTDTGRFSCSEPNIMTLEQYLRAMYWSAPGYRLVHADYSQLELRVMAAVAGDEVLQQRLNLGDVYGEDAKDWFGLPADMNVKKMKPKARQTAKVLHLASQYSAGTEAVYLQALAQEHTLKYQTAALLHAGFKKTYAQTCDYWWAEQARVKSTGYSESRILNRRRVYPTEPPITEVANYPIQSTASDVVNLAMIEIDKRLAKYFPTAGFVDQLHDAFDVEAKIKDVPAVSELVQEVMEQPHVINGKTYKFPVEMKTGRLWSEL